MHSEHVVNSSGVVIITPVYEDADSARILFRELAKSVSGVRVVAVDDGSLRSPVDGNDLREAGIKGMVIKLRRNIGHQGAIAVGLSYAYQSIPDFKYVVVMDSDGEDTPESIRVLLDGFDGLGAEVRVAERNKRSESLKFRIFYQAYKFLFRLMTGKAINFGNFMVLKRTAVARLTAMNEIWIHLAASVIASRLRIHGIKIDRGTRYSGHSKMNFVGLVLHGFKGVMVFSEQVLIRMGVASLMVAILSVIVILAALILKSIDAASPGWLTNVVTAMVLIFLQTGVMTLVIFMITGLVRIGTLNRIDHQALVDQVIMVD